MIDTITFFRSLKPDDWSQKVTEKWTVKDVLSHLVGWEREVAIELKNIFENGEEPWFIKTDDYSEFNEKIYKEFQNNSPKELLIALEKWQRTTEKEIQDIGEAKIRQHKDVSWVFDEGDEPHIEHHINQIKKALNRF